MRRLVDHSLRRVVLASALCAGLLTSVQGSAQAPAAGAPAATAPAATSAPAAAPQAPPAAPTAEQQAAARAAYARGQAAFAAGRFADARSAFGEAFAAVANPVVLLPIAESETSLGELAAARTTLRRYLELRPDAPDRAEVERKIAELESHPGKLTITSEPAKARVRVDGAETPHLTPVELELAVGEHRIELALDGYEPAAVSAVIEPGARQDQRVELTPKAPVPMIAATPALAAAAAPASAPVAEEGPPTAALWVCGIVGASGIIAGTVLGFLALEEHSEFEKEPTVESADRGEKLALFADVSFAMGAMALITGAVLYFTAGSDDPPPAPAESKASTARLELRPHVSPSQVAASARVTF